MTFISTSLELVLARFSTALTQQRPRLLVVALAQPTGSLTGTASPADATPTKKGLGVSSPVMCTHAITALDPLPCTSLPRHHVPLVEDHNTQFDLLHLLVMLGDDVRNNSAS